MTLDAFNLEGRVAVITGAARGQGAADARLLAAAGCAIVATDVLEEEGQSLCSEMGDRAVFVRHDVTEEAGWRRVVDIAVATFGRLDVLVNNAGVHRSRPLLDEDVDAFKRILEVNLVGAFLGIRAVAEPMRQGGKGSIVNVSSVAGIRGLAGHSSYGASKWGLRGLSQTAAVELGPFGIRVNSIIPGAIDTAMMTSLTDSTADRFAHLPLGRHGEADEIAPVVLFLSSDASSYLTGAEIVVDGGMAAMVASTAPRPSSP
jgi:3alpha(or 20beta)-hydroxysteroid dehydrogenase